MKRFSLVVLELLGVLALTLALVNVAPYPLRALPLSLIIIIWRLYLGNEELLWLYTVVFGLYLELFRAAPFGMSIFSLALTTIFIHWISSSLITNRTLPALLMLSAGALVLFRLTHTVGALILDIVLQQSLEKIDAPGTLLLFAAEFMVGLLVQIGAYAAIKVMKPRLLKEGYA